jgi:hypothetical protein
MLFIVMKLWQYPFESFELTHLDMSMLTIQGCFYIYVNLSP